jgi:hypothetical protein
MSDEPAKEAPPMERLHFDSEATARVFTKEKTHSRLVRDMLDDGAKSVESETRCLAIAQIDEDSLPYLALEILGHNGLFEKLFECRLLTQDALSVVHVPPLVRLSMYGQPVARCNSCTAGGNLPDGNS